MNLEPIRGLRLIAGTSGTFLRKLKKILNFLAFVVTGDALTYCSHVNI